MKKLHKSATDRKICGVCGGLAEYFGIDSTVVRLLFAILSLLSGIGIAVYLAAVFIMPKDEEGTD